MSANSIFKPGLTAAQQPAWPDAAAVKSAVAELETFPPLVFAGECDNLKSVLPKQQPGEHFGCKVAIVLKHLSGLPLIQFEIELRQSCRWQPFFSTSHPYQWLRWGGWLVNLLSLVVMIMKPEMA